MIKFDQFITKFKISLDLQEAQPGDMIGKQYLILEVRKPKQPFVKVFCLKEKKVTKINIFWAKLNKMKVHKFEMEK